MNDPRCARTETFTMHFFGTLKTVFLCLIFGYIGKLVVGRAMYFNDCYRDAVQIRKTYSEQLEACEDDTTYHKFEKACVEAKKESVKWPAGVAFTETLKHTHSCIEYPCSEILKDFMQSWITIIVLAALVFFAILIVFIWVYNRTKMQPIGYYTQAAREPIVYEISSERPLQIKSD